MTEQEAIKRLEFLNDALNPHRVDSDESSCALQMGMEALEKQIPKKPFEDKENSYFWTCPTCRCELYWDTDYGQQKFKHCSCCGQKLDWSDEDD